MTSSSSPALATATCVRCGAQVGLVDAEPVRARLARQAELDAQLPLEDRRSPEEIAQAVLYGELRAVGRWVIFNPVDDSHELTCGTCVEETKLERAAATCPPWCVTDHAGENLAGEWVFWHAAPVAYVGRWSYTEELSVSVQEVIDTNVDLSDVERTQAVLAELRTTAADLQAAADWIEGLR